jgi:polyferredoxin
LAITLSAIFIGRRFCGYICFLGTIQAALFNLRIRLYPKKNLRKKNDDLLKKIKYVVLLTTLILTITYLSHLYMKFCPVLALAEIKYIGLSGLISLLTILLFGFIIERFWCRYLCPYAALMNVVQVLGSFIGIKRSVLKRKKCSNCGICSNVCPMKIDLEKVDKITDPNCIHCLRCVKHCPDTGKIDY